MILLFYLIKAHRFPTRSEDVRADSENIPYSYFISE